MCITHNNPKVSIIIPVKNGEKIIHRCLEAVLSQTMDPCEIIVVDGNSTDRTVEEAKEFPVRIIFEDYNTVGGGRQVGLENANGEYVAFTDADCIPQRNWLENLVKEFHGNIVGVGGSLKNVGEGFWGKSIALILNTFVGSANSVQGRLFKEKRFVKSISGCNSMYRRETLMKIGGFDTTLSVNEETEINRRLSKVGKLLYTPDAIVLHDQCRGLRKFAKRMYQFGYGRGSLRLWDLQCAPPLLVSLLFFSLLFTPLIFIAAMMLYALVLIAMGLKFAIQDGDIRYMGFVPIVYAIEHGSYTIGFFMGLLNV